MSYPDSGYPNCCFHCGRDKEEIYLKKGNVDCSSCKRKYLQEIAEEEKANRPTLRDQLAMSAPFESIEKCLRAREDYGDLTDRKYLELVCDARYYYADTMLKQRDRVE